MSDRKYVNAKNVLPDHLIKEIQKYVQGKYVYIPKTERLAWGVSTGIREELNQRNEQIVNDHNEGFDLPILAEMYCLSEERVRAILYGYVYPFRDNQEGENTTMQDEQEFVKNNATKLFTEKAEKYQMPVTLVDIKYDIWNGRKILFFYCRYHNPDARLDFRELLKDLGDIYQHSVGFRQVR